MHKKTELPYMMMSQKFDPVLRFLFLEQLLTIKIIRSTMLKTISPVYSAKTRSRGIGRAFLCALHPLFESIEGFLFYLTKKGETCDGQLFDMAFHRFK